jgi:hypothetical protein
MSTVICVRVPHDGEREIYLVGAAEQGGICWSADINDALRLPHDSALRLLWSYQRGALYTRKVEA